VAIALFVIAIVLAGFLGYQWTQSRYYVGRAPDGNIAIYQGVQQTLGPIPLSHIYEETNTKTSSLSGYEKQQVMQTINADTLDEARGIVKRLTDDG
jgi:protein phosphatase